MFAVHIDNIIMISSFFAENDLFKSQLRQHWEISNLGNVKYALSIGFTRDHSSHAIALSQTVLIDCVMEQFGQLDAHLVDTPMVPGMQITCPDKTIPISKIVDLWIQCTPYQSLVRTLNYLTVATHPDIAFAVEHLASVLDCYRPEHWDVAIRVVHYLKRTRLYNLTLDKANAIHPLSFAC